MGNDRVTILTDTGSDMLPQEAEKLGIVLLPLKVRFGDQEFDDGFTLSRDEFYNRLIESDVLPKTSQIPPALYEEAFRKEVDAGREVVCLTLSSKISGCFQSASLAARSFDGKVRVVDTMHFCGSEYILAQRAAQMRDEGMTAADIAAAVEKEKTEVQIIAVFDTLEYARKGGRVSAVAAGLGGLLSIKPVVTIRNGGVHILGKARGSKNGNNYLNRLVNENGGIDFSKPLLLSWSGFSEQLLDKYVEDSAALYEGVPAEKLPRSRVGATIGTYTGPGCIALSFYPKGKAK